MLLRIDRPGLVGHDSGPTGAAIRKPFVQVQRRATLACAGLQEYRKSADCPALISWGGIGLNRVRAAA
jgi:hypothetical protein